ncbi:hypothetical protein [Rhodoferax sp. BAB1]|uniref:hypothetical protein n=1 Tax=Rhodoferax sp. BAB1 TaxID=2741720 RepID=UPI001C2DC495|nr:hypothetical protein [Rhodoferax sp. BAB1]
MKTTILRLLLAFLAILLLLAGGWIWFTLSWSYAEGERAGYVQKLSNKGWLCKTWEGEIAMVTMPGAIPEKFEFTVRDEAVVQQINDLSGKRVVLHYRQHKFIPTTCFGETEYFVSGVREVREGVMPAPLAPPVPQQGQLSAPR